MNDLSIRGTISVRLRALRLVGSYLGIVAIETANNTITGFLYAILFGYHHFHLTLNKIAVASARHCNECLRGNVANRVLKDVTAFVVI